MPTDLTPDAFAAWARAVGLTGDAAHLETLRPEVEAMLRRVAPLDEIAVDGVSLEQAVGGAE